MKTIANVQRILAAAALTSGLLSVGVAASAQTTAAPVTPQTTASTTNSVALSTVDSKAQRQADLEKINADARRVEFRNLGTSL
jgi:hypothetical protein